MEAAIALSILACTVTAVLAATGAAHQHQAHAADRLRAAQLADDLLEEIASRPYTGAGGSRASFCIDEYDGMSEPPGALTHASGVAYQAGDQRFKREVQVVSNSIALPGISAAPLPGKHVILTVTCPAGQVLEFSRFIPEPATP